MDQKTEQKFLDLLPRYFELLDEAHFAHSDVDDFDLRSEDPTSVKEYKRLTFESVTAQIALVTFIRDNAANLSFAFGLATGQTIRRLDEGA